MTRPTNVFLHYFPAEGFYKVSSSGKEAQDFVIRSGWLDHVELIWTTAFPVTAQAESFKFSVLSGLTKYRPTTEPNIKSSRTSYKGDPINLDSALANGTGKSLDDEVINIYLLNLGDNVHKVGFSKENPRTGKYHDKIVWNAETKGRTMAEAITTFIMRECCASKVSVDGYTFRQAFIPNVDISDLNTVRQLFAKWIAKNKDWNTARPAPPVIIPTEQF